MRYILDKILSSEEKEKVDILHVEKLYPSCVFSPCLCLAAPLHRPPQGHMTGKCVGNTTKTCEVVAWCPVEDDHAIPEYVGSLKILLTLYIRPVAIIMYYLLYVLNVTLNWTKWFVSYFMKGKWSPSIFLRWTLCTSMCVWCVNALFVFVFYVLLFSVQSRTFDVGRELHTVHQKLCHLSSIWC